MRFTFTRWIRIYSYILLFLSNFFPALSQEIPFRHFGVEDGIPSSEVHCSMQDSKGYMWFGTDRGVVRFDGNEFEVYTTKDGLPGNVVFALAEDPDRKIWIGSASKQLAYFEDGRFVPYKYNHLIQRSQGQLMTDVHFDKAGTIFVAIYPEGILSISANGVPDYLTFSKTGSVLFPDKILFTITDINNRSMLSMKNPSDFDHITSKRVLFRYEGQPLLLDTLFDNNLYTSATSLVIHRKSDQFHYLAYQNQLFKINASQNTIELKYQSKGNILDLLEEPEGIWLGTGSKGAIFLPDPNSDTDTIRILSNYSVSTIERDVNGGYWFGTLENGIYYASFLLNKVIKVKSGEPTGYVTTIAGSPDGEIIFGQKDGKVYRVNKGNAELIYNSISEIKSTVYNPTKKRFELVSSEYIRINGDEIKHLNYKVFAPRQIVSLRNGKTIGCGEIIIYLTDSIKGISDDNIRNLTNSLGLFRKLKRPCVCLGAKSVDTIYIGSDEGLVRYVRQDGQYRSLELRNQNSLFSGRITSLATTHKGFVIGTQNHGVVVVIDNDVSSFSTKNGLTSDHVSYVYVDDYEGTWACTNSGLNYIAPDKTIHRLTTDHGLISNEVTSVYRDRNQIWVATKKGLQRISMKVFDNPALTNPVHIKSIERSDGLAFNANAKYIDLPYNKNSLNIKITTFNYKMQGNTEYRYKLKNLGKEWIYGTGNQINLSYIPIGNHVLLIQALNENGEWVPDTTELVLIVSPPFWKTSWFSILLSALVLLILVAIFYIRSGVKRKQDKLIAEINEYQQQALAAQMNPHFIFNSLNSIQSFIAQNDRKLSNHYLSRFAKLMRIILNNSRSPEVSISEELSALELYLELESVRYKNFSYNIEISPDLNPHKTIIPPLLIQPLAENAIWHGLMHKSEYGNLSIRFTREGNEVVCCVEDNGVGRAYSTTKIGQKQHKSLSTSITNKRLELIGSQYGKKYALEITDLCDENNTPVGTKVCFRVPYKLHSS